jgi:hypothetical protein
VTSIPASADDGPRSRVALATAPPLLARSLAALLPDDVEVTVVLEPTADLRADLAIVTPGGPAVTAPVTVLLDDRPAARGGGTARFVDGRPERVLPDLAAVLAFVGEVLPAAVPR